MRTPARTTDSFVIAVLGIIGVTAPSRVSHAAIGVSASTSSAIVCDSAVIIGNGTNGPYWLSGYYLVSQSETVSQHEDSCSRDAYRIDYDRGRMQFTAPLAAGDSVLVRFRRLAWSLPSEWQLAGVSSAPMEESVVRSIAFHDRAYIAPPASPSPGPRSDPGSTLKWQGYKSFSVTTSSTRGADWSQGLELSVTGELTPGLTLGAALSDRFADAGQVSNRRDGTRVGDLEQFFIETRSANFQGRMGDFVLAGRETRHAAGVQSAWHDDASRIDAYLGHAEGQTVRRSIAISPRISGPYFLTARSQSAAHPVAGTIVLWLDGRRLTEGPDRDFTFDPVSEAISLTPGITPAVSATIIAEFEQTLDDYRRSLAGGGWAWNRPRLRNDLRLTWEGDDPAHPIFGELSDAQRAILGQSPGGQITTGSAQYRGAERGDYRLEMKGADSVYIYAGPDNGDWRVSFEYTGVGMGRYRHVAEAAYEYVGQGLGSYEPTSTLGAPSSALTIHESLTFSPQHAGVVQAQVLAHLDDPNRLAANTSTTSSDHYLSWMSSAPGGHRVDRDRMRLDWRRRGTSRTQEDMSLDNLSRFSTDWGLRAELFDSTRDEYSAGFVTSDSRWIAGHADAGVAQYSVEDAIRVSLGTRATPLSGLNIQTDFQRVEAHGGGTAPGWQGYEQHVSTGVSFDAGPALATMGWSESNRANPSHIFEPRSDFVATRRIGIERDGITAEYRWDRTRDSSITPLRRTRSLTLNVPLGVLHAGNGRLVATRGEESIDDSPYAPFYSGQLNGTWAPATAMLLTADMTLARTRSGVQREVYLPTRPGEGQYRLERGEYLPDIHGDYRRVIATDDLQSITGYDGRQRLTASWRPEFAGWRWTIESRTERIARHDPTQFRPLPWLAPWRRSSWAAAAGSRAERYGYHRIGVRPDNTTELTLDYDLTHATESTNDVHDRRDRVGASARRSLDHDWYIEGQTDWEFRERQGVLNAPIDALARTWRLILGGTPHTGLTSSIEGRHRTDHDKISGGQTRLLGVRPRLQASLGALGVTIDNDCTWVTSESAPTSFSALLAEGRPSGFSVQETVEARWQLPGRVTLRSRLYADLRETGADRWRWELETIARF